MLLLSNLQEYYDRIKFICSWKRRKSTKSRPVWVGLNGRQASIKAARRSVHRGGVGVFSRGVSSVISNKKLRYSNTTHEMKSFSVSYLTAIHPSALRTRCYVLRPFDTLLSSLLTTFVSEGFIHSDITGQNYMYT